LRPFKLIASNRSSSPLETDAIGRAAWRSPQSTPDMIPRPGRARLVMSTRTGQFGSGSNGSILPGGFVHCRSSRTALERDLSGKPSVENWNEVQTYCAGTIGDLLFGGFGDSGDYRTGTL